MIKEYIFICVLSVFLPHDPSTEMFQRADLAHHGALYISGSQQFSIVICRVNKE
jgi:hypothetical protein